MNGLINAALGRTRTVLATLVLLLIAGVIAYNGIPKESSPDVNIPIIYVSMHHEGISPQDSERLLLRPMEQQLRTIEGVKEMRSTAYLGGGNVILEFEAGFNADKGLADVREKVDLARPELPAEMDEPTVNEVNFSLFPVLVVTLSGDAPERTLLRLARDLQDKIEGIPSVLKAEIAGNREELVEIVVDPLLVESYGLNGNDIIQLFNRSNRLVTAGNLDTGQGRFAIKVPGLFEGVRDIMAMPIKANGDALVRVRDVAEIRRTFKDAETFARVNGNRAVALEVSKRAGENLIDTVEAVRKVVEQERAFWPGAVQVTYLQDRSNDIRTMLGDLENNLAITVLLVMIIVVASLGLRTSTLIGVAVPGSFLTAILVLAGMGYTINIVVLFGLILAAGNVVDGAIVVTEYADRKMIEGMHRRHAYGLAARRMAWPIIASTATQLAAFAPLLLWPGVVGEFMKFLPISQFATLLAALLMALIFIPVLGALVGRPNGPVMALPSGHTVTEDDPVEQRQPLEGPYVALLKWCLRRPLTVLAAAAVLLVGVQWYYATHGNGIEFFPDIEPEQAIVLVHARGNLSVYEKDGLMREVEQRVLGIAGIRSVYTRTGQAGQGGGMGGDLGEDVIGQITVEFSDWKTRPTANELLAEARRRTADLAGIKVETRKEEGGPPVGKPVQLQLSSRNPELLPAAAASIQRGLAEIGGFVDVEDSRPMPGIEWQIKVDRAEAAKFSLDLTAIGDSVRMVTNGLKVGEFRPDDSNDEVDIVIRYPTESRSLAQLDNIRVESPLGSIPIGSFVQRTAEPRVSKIDRVDGMRVLTVKADVEPGILPDTKVQEIRAWLAKNRLDPGIAVKFKGEDEEQKKSQAFLTNAFGAGIFLIAIILLTQFNSFYSTGLILSAVLMSTIGVFIGLIVTGQPFGIVMTGIGVIALAGIVVQNNIVLIDTYDQYRHQEPSEYEAILRTGAERLRPVLLTALNTVLGLLPLTFGVNVDLFTREITVGAPATQWWTQLSTAICFGLTFATVLTLVVTPCALMVRANIRAWRDRRRGRQPRAMPQPQPAE